MRPGDIRVFVPSYRRSATRIQTQARYPFATLVVAESEADAYRRSGNRVIACPDSAQGNLCRVRNWILDQHQDAAGVVLLDDDYTGIGIWHRRSARWLSATEVEELIEASFILAEDLGVYLWGLNCTYDKGAYREYTPFSMVAYIGGPFRAHRPNPLRYDERLPLKEDYDLTLQHLNRYRRVLRLNRHFYKVRQHEQAGGCSAYRTVAREREQFTALRAKWGANIVRVDGGQDKAMVRGAHTRRGYDLNPRLHVPIRGV